MSTFPRMHKIIVPQVIGRAAIRHAKVSKFEATMSSMRGIPTDPGKFAVLEVDGKVVMSDTYNEQRSNREIVREARGSVLIAGLGMGMILHPILASKDVRSVLVVEKERDVIDLIRPTLPASDKLSILCADIFEWQPLPGAKWDVIYFDIWADICTDNLPQIAKLHQRFKSRKTPGGWMNSWYAEELRDTKRREDRNSY